MTRAQIAKMFWDWTRGPQLGGEWDGLDNENVLAKIHAHNFADALLVRLFLSKPLSPTIIFIFGGLCGAALITVVIAALIARTI